MTCSITGVAYELGHPRPVNELGEGNPALAPSIKALLDYGLDSYRASDVPVTTLASRSIVRTLETASAPVERIGAVVYATESFGGEQATARALGMLLADVGLKSAYPLPIFGALCGNLLPALELACDIVNGGESEDVLVVLADVERSQESRIVHPPVTVSSDGALSFLVTRRDVPGFKVRGLTKGIHSLGRSLDRGESGFRMLQEAQQAIKAQITTHLDRVGLPRDGYRQILVNNYLSSTTRFFAMSAGFGTDRLFTGTVGEMAHVGASDTLINAQECVRRGLARHGDSLLLLSNGLSANIDMWGFITLEVVHADHPHTP